MSYWKLATIRDLNLLLLFCFYAPFFFFFPFAERCYETHVASLWNWVIGLLLGPLTQWSILARHCKYDTTYWLVRASFNYAALSIRVIRCRNTTLWLRQLQQTITCQTVLSIYLFITSCWKKSVRKRGMEMYSIKPDMH